MSTQDARNGGCGLRVSRDGGLSWATTAENLLPGQDQFCVHRNFGPVMDPEFASDGSLYVGLSSSSTQTDPPHPNGPITALVAGSDDLGRTSETFTVAEPEGFLFTPPDGGDELEGYSETPMLVVGPDSTVYAFTQGVAGRRPRGHPGPASTAVHVQVEREPSQSSTIGRDVGLLRLMGKLGKA